MAFDLAYAIGIGLPYLVLLGQVSLIAALLAWALEKQSTSAKKIVELLRRYASESALTVSLVATLGSLYYSEIIGFVPCKLCVFQRILMYPQTIFLAGAVLREKMTIGREILVLCGLGVLLSGYHYGLQMFAMATPGFSDACSATGVSCASTEVFAFGYMTIPLMSFTAFVMIAVLLLIDYHKDF